MQSLPAVNAVLAALGKAAAKGLDAKSMKKAGFDLKVLQAAGFDSTALQAAGFSKFATMAGAGMKSEFCIVIHPLLRIEQTQQHTDT